MRYILTSAAQSQRRNPRVKIRIKVRLQAAEAGSVPALFNLACCYARGIGTGSTWNYKKAAECVERFAGQMTGEEKIEEFFYFGYR